MYKVALLLVPCILSIVLVHGYGGVGGYGGSGGGINLAQSPGYPLDAYSNAVALQNSGSYAGNDRLALANYRNPNRYAFLLPLALSLLLALNLTAIPTIG